jgi:hypothetical protein
MRLADDRGVLHISRMTRYRFVQFSNIGWRQRFGLAAVIVLGLAAVLAFVLLSVGFAIVLLPVAAVAWLVARWRLNQMADALRRDSGARQGEPDPRTIEVEYHVIGHDEAERK